MGHTREYGKVRRQSPGVYEADSGPLTDEWTAYSQVGLESRGDKKTQWNY